jgi:hypothetical protein
MRSLAKLAAVSFSLACAIAAPRDPGRAYDPWRNILRSVHVEQQVIVLPMGSSASPQHARLAESGRFIVIQGESKAAEGFGFRFTKKRVLVRAVLEARAPKLSILWETPAEVPVVEVPKDAQVFARDKHSGAPLVAGVRLGSGGVLWVATDPGERGYERFPYILHALRDLGLNPAVASNRLWAFFDTSYRSRVDVDYFAARWRKAGIAALHVASWQYHEPDTARDAYLKKLIEACHKNGILVYAWVELPHVSEKFWNDHPEWREKTALLQDAHLDWRKLMNLQNPDCRKAVARDLRALFERFDWDGVNLGELYFESLEGFSNKARFTPMNDDVRRMYRERYGVDPVTIEAGQAAELRRFLEFRAELVRRMQADWVSEVEAMHTSKPGLDLVLTHIDDRYDTRMRDLLGADAASALPMLEQHDFTFLVEDPATLWHLGPERYPQIAAKYKPLTAKHHKVAIDINIVERYQDVYPTKQQTGSELFQLVSLASSAFPRVALYFENSILKQDWDLLPASAATPHVLEVSEGGVVVDSSQPVGVRWSGSALVDGKPWPVQDGSFVWVPAGRHQVTRAAEAPALRVLDLNGELLRAEVTKGSVELEYQSDARAILRLSAAPREVWVGKDKTETGTLLRLPAGRHVVKLVP